LPSFFGLRGKAKFGGCAKFTDIDQPDNLFTDDRIPVRSSDLHFELLVIVTLKMV
jgi:hypothetical protein